MSEFEEVKELLLTTICENNHTTDRLTRWYKQEKGCISYQDGDILEAIDKRECKQCQL